MVLIVQQMKYVMLCSRQNINIFKCLISEFIRNLGNTNLYGLFFHSVPVYISLSSLRKMIVKQFYSCTMQVLLVPYFILRINKPSNGVVYKTAGC